MAGAVYEGKYPLATALGRPLIAKLMVDVARKHKARAVAHGCTGKGNDQVRFDVTFQTLAPDLKDRRPGAGMVDDPAAIAGVCRQAQYPRRGQAEEPV